MKKLKMIAAILVLSSQGLAAQLKEGLLTNTDAQRRGGANVVTETFKSAASLILEILKSYKGSESDLTPTSKVILDEKIGLLMGEFASVRLTVDDKSEEQFDHHGDSGTWIETDFAYLGEIRVRTKVMKKMVGDLSSQQAIHYLSHEIGHHLYGRDEETAWSLASAIVELISRKVSLTSLLNISSQPYEGSQKGCRDQARFKADALNGLLVAYVSSSKCNVPNAGSWVPGIDNLPELNKHLAELTITYVCKKYEGRTLCAPQSYPEIELNWGKAEILPDGSVVISYWYHLLFDNMGRTDSRENRKIVQEYRVK